MQTQFIKTSLASLRSLLPDLPPEMPHLFMEALQQPSCRDAKWGLAIVFGKKQRGFSQ